MSQVDELSLSDIFGEDGFNSEDYEPTSDFEVLPPGKYVVQIEEAEIKRTKAGNGYYIKIQMTSLGRVGDDKFKNRKLWDNINIDNPSEQCTRIGRCQLSALKQALGIIKLTDTTQLLNGIVIAHVKVKNDQNEIRTYSAVNSAGTSVTPEQSESTPSADQQGDAQTLPWQR